MTILHRTEPHANIMGDPMKRSMAVIILIFLAGAVFARNFRFTVTNNARINLVEMKISEKGKSDWQAFDIGSAIRPGQTVLLIWDEQPNEEDCEWAVKVKYADGQERESVINFCSTKKLFFAP